ncbi:MAG: CRISPR system precrRNA processing endoribonuclease RAMP protein Cas6 [Thermoprotei archaeon]
MPMLFAAKYRVRPLLRDGEEVRVLPPISSKLFKNVVEKERHPFAALLSSKEQYKPVQVTPVKVGNDYLIAGLKGKLSAMRAGEEGEIRVSLVGDFEFDDFDALTGDHHTDYGPFRFDLVDLTVLDPEELVWSGVDTFTIRFETPTLLSSKLMIPPPLSEKLKGRVKPFYKLVPQPSLIFSSAVRLWNSLPIDPKLKIVRGDESWTPYLIGREADYTFAEVGYEIRPVTVNLGRDERGRAREARGFMGRVKYKVIYRKGYERDFSRLLPFIKLMGLGKSRGLGLGVVDVLVEGVRAEAITP